MGLRRVLNCAAMTDARTLQRREVSALAMGQHGTKKSAVTTDVRSLLRRGESVEGMEQSQISAASKDAPTKSRREVSVGAMERG